MKIAIDKIVVLDTHRIRQDIGDLGPLKESIAKVGLINPILIDETNTLIAGYRRLASCKELEWTEIEVQIIQVNGDAIHLLDMELAENLHRKDFTSEELLAAEEKRKAILEAQRPKSILERFWLWLKGLFSSSKKKKKDTETSQAPHKEENKAAKETIHEQPSQATEKEGKETDTDPSPSS